MVTFQHGQFRMSLGMADISNWSSASAGICQASVFRGLVLRAARTLVTRIGKLELRVPQDRGGRFSTELFERYQTLGAGAGCGAGGDVRAGGFDSQSQDDHRGVVRPTAFRPRRSARSTSGWMRAWRNLPAVPWPKPSPI